MFYVVKLYSICHVVFMFFYLGAYKEELHHTQGLQALFGNRKNYRYSNIKRHFQCHHK